MELENPDKPRLSGGAGIESDKRSAALGRTGVARRTRNLIRLRWDGEGGGDVAVSVE